MYEKEFPIEPTDTMAKPMYSGGGILFYIYFNLDLWLQVQDGN
jgi:hypothetical protein